MPPYDYDCAACGRRFEVIHGVHADRPDELPVVWRRAGSQGDHGARDPLQGVGLGEEGASRDGAASGASKPADAAATAGEGEHVDGRRRHLDAGEGGHGQGRRPTKARVGKGDSTEVGVDQARVAAPPTSGD